MPPHVTRASCSLRRLGTCLLLTADVQVGCRLDNWIRQMPISGNASSADAIRRKLRALTAVLFDPAATEPERANAKELKVRLEKQLAEEPAPEGKWTGMMFGSARW